MPQEYDVCFHLGLPKVASTFLQKEIFPQLNNVKFHKKRDFNKYKQLDPHELECNHLFSSEKDYNMEEALDDIMERFPNAKIILLLRRQDKWILSRYKYYIRKHGWKKFDDFFDLHNNRGDWKREHLLFKNKIEYIVKNTNVPPLILTLDLLKNDPDLFFKKIFEYTNSNMQGKKIKNTVVKRAFTDKQLILLRRFNSIYPYQKKKTPCRIINRIHYRYRQYLLHTVAFFSRLLPNSLVAGEEIVDDSRLEEIKRYYQDDWSFCENYVKKQNL